jgi:uncharacterized membrane protein YidH (DUF202 family)
MKKVALISGAALLVPFVTSAQTLVNEAGFTGVFTSIQNIIAAALPLIISIAVLLFLWGLVRYMTNADDAEERAKARGLMVWGVIIIFVMVSLWGLVNFLAGLFSLTNTPIAPPGLPGAAA